VHFHGEIASFLDEHIHENKDIEDILARKYLKDKVALFNSTRGAFSLAIEDYSQGELLLVRDKIGEIPLYYSIQSGKVYWGNRICDILRQSKDPFELNEDVIHEYLVFRYISSTNTMFKNIHEVLPAHFVKVHLNTGHVEEHAYWDIPYPPADQQFPADKVTIVDRIEGILKKSIENGLSHHLRHGVMSSGGVDSSLIIAIASGVHKEKLKTCFIGFDGYESDRSSDAEAVAQWYNTDHSTFYLNAEQYACGLPDTIRLHEEPLNHPGHVGRALFNKHNQRDIDCLLLGEGVDTMFCGSKAYPLIKIAYQNNYLRGLTKRIFENISVNYIPNKYKRHYRMIRDAFTMEPADYLIYSLAVNDPDEVEKLMVEESKLDYLEYYRSFLHEYNKRNIHLKFLRLNQHPFMVEVLNSEFKFGSEYNIQNYYPFLDVDLVSYANHIPYNLRSRGLTGKYIIKKLAERYFPRSFVYKRKEGFGVPLKKYFDDPKGMGRYYDLLRDKRTSERGIFDSNRLAELVDKTRHCTHASDELFEGLIWSIINLELWCRIYLDQHGCA